MSKVSPVQIKRKPGGPPSHIFGEGEGWGGKGGPGRSLYLNQKKIKYKEGKIVNPPKKVQTASSLRRHVLIV